MLRSRPRGGVCLLKQHRKSYWKNEERKEVLKILRGPFIENEYKSLRNKNQRFFFPFQFSNYWAQALNLPIHFVIALKVVEKQCADSLFFSLSESNFQRWFMSSATTFLRSTTLVFLLEKSVKAKVRKVEKWQQLFF